MGKAVRKQFYLSPELNKVLADTARQQNLPEAEIVRRALEEYMLKQFSIPPEEPIAALTGIAQGGRKKG